MGPAGADLPAGLLALRHDIATAEHSITANRWLTKQPTASVLADLAAGRMPLTHEAFDQLPKRPALEHLRLTLVAVGALPERDEELVRLEQALTDFLTQQQDLNRRRILHRYLIWNLLRRLRSRNNGRRTTRQQVLRIRLHRRAAAAFLDWLDAHHLTLDVGNGGIRTVPISDGAISRPAPHTTRRHRIHGRRPRRRLRSRPRRQRRSYPELTLAASARHSPAGRRSAFVGVVDWHLTTPGEEPAIEQPGRRRCEIDARLYETRRQEQRQRNPGLGVFR